MDDRSAEVQSLIRIVQVPAISKTVLQSICAVNGIPKTGKKNELQRRIIQQIQSCAESRDWARLKEIRESIANRAPVYITPARVSQVPVPQVPVPQVPPPQWQPQVKSQSTSQPWPQSLPRSTSHQTSSSQPSSSYAMPPYGQSAYDALNGLRSQNPPAHSLRAPQGSSGNRALPGLNVPTITFKASPFYEIKYQVGDVKTLEVMTSHRNSEKISVRVQDHPALQLCFADKNMRVMVFCAAGKDGVQEIAFPYQCELKVNGGDIKANLRGLKNRPGSTRPVDITSSLRLKQSGYTNNVELTYALTQRKFYMCLIVCRAIPIETLVAQINKKIRKSSVITEITKKASDPDVVTTSQNLSLKCPLSYMRLKLPCRAIGCNHIQCFDATSYLQLQEQGPQWICPICNKSAPFEQLAIDEYAREILTKTSEDVEQVTIEPNGEWSMPGTKKKDTPNKETSYVEDEDVVVSSVTRTAGRTTKTPGLVAAPPAHLATPTSVASRDTSAAPRSASGKRPAPEVIDLTLSDDDEPPRPVKRANLGHQYSTVPY
ncbi:PINIT domain-containing protein [Chaetomium strumarium]|uniref:PINIT domain-containing protein n=1 Tax=Chaetomium strumarium TaxID=1170767 RepID=A0AAJ0GKH6_9PEZI|nr:PINIT domain-containing protein [Chaetomium strumarium]